mmetsp:Transcript_57199/g.147127  ORF Transcript_57199/g.147127 Transcript_57199/m.147127 type:complete len:222 (+) Transcript_57199:489-1154(+)
MLALLVGPRRHAEGLQHLQDQREARVALAALQAHRHGCDATRAQHPACLPQLGIQVGDAAAAEVRQVAVERGVLERKRGRVGDGNLRQTFEASAGDIQHALTEVAGHVGPGARAAGALRRGEEGLGRPGVAAMGLHDVQAASSSPLLRRREEAQVPGQRHRHGRSRHAHVGGVPLGHAIPARRGQRALRWRGSPAALPRPCSHLVPKGPKGQGGSPRSLRG